MAGQTQGAVTRLSIDGVKMCFKRVEDKSVFKNVDGAAAAICGSLAHNAARVAPGIALYRLHILLEPTPEELDTLIPIMGYTEDTDVFTLTEDYSSLGVDVVVDRSAKVHTYTGMKVDKAIWRGQKGVQPVSLELQMVGTGFSEGSSFGSPTDPSATAPYAFSMGTLSLLGNTEVFDRFVLVQDNHMAIQHNNSVDPTSVVPAEQTFSLGISTPYTSDEAAILTTFTSAGREDGGAAAVKFENDNGQSTQIALANVKWEATPPSILGKQEVRLDQFYTGYATSGTEACIITHHATAS